MISVGLKGDSRDFSRPTDALWCPASVTDLNDRPAIAHAGPALAKPRVEGIDVARGLAGLIMIQGHAFHGWATPEAKQTGYYAFTRVLGALPLPSFLVLAGAAVALRVHAAAQRGESAERVRGQLIKRGLQVTLYGYLVNFVYMLMDGFESWDVLLRADVLQCIGLSIALMSFVGVRATGEAVAPSERLLGRWALGLGLIVTGIAPFVNRVSVAVDGPARFVVGLFADAPDVTRMPLVPLLAWFGFGVVVCQQMMRMNERRASFPARGASRPYLLLLLASGIALAYAGDVATDIMVDALGGTLTRAHLAVWPNVFAYFGRGLVVLSVGALLTDLRSERAKRVFLRVGRGSLVAYVFHIPFCYGALGAPFINRLDMAEGTILVLALMVLSVLAVYLRDYLRDTMAARHKPSTPHATATP